jgi:hypothetical protein
VWLLLPGVGVHPSSRSPLYLCYFLLEAADFCDQALGAGGVVPDGLTGGIMLKAAQPRSSSADISKLQGLVQPLLHSIKLQDTTATTHVSTTHDRNLNEGS